MFNDNEMKLLNTVKDHLDRLEAFIQIYAETSPEVKAVLIELAEEFKHSMEVLEEVEK